MADISKVMADKGLLDGLTTIAARAAAIILAIPPSTLAQRDKLDRSPVTVADEASQAAIFEGLGRLLPGIPVASEEAMAGVSPAEFGPEFLLVDPLDGTRELLAGRDEFTVNIALISNGSPRAGVVVAPARGLIWRGIVGGGAERLALTADAGSQTAPKAEAIHTRTWPKRGPVALVSRSHLDPATEAYIAQLKPTELIGCGSSLKFCQLAEGAADLYPRLAETSEWDVAAGHAVLAAAGGTVIAPDGRPLSYGQSGFRIPAFIAWGDRTAARAC